MADKPDTLITLIETLTSLRESQCKGGETVYVTLRNGQLVRLECEVAVGEPTVGAVFLYEKSV